MHLKSNHQKVENTLHSLSLLSEQTFPNIETIDGIAIDALWIPGNEVDPEAATVILFNANKQLIEHKLDLALNYRKAGFNVLLFNYRGTGKGKKDCSFNPSRDSLIEDGEAVYRYAKELTEDDKKIILHGHSLGGAIAAYVAANHPGCHILNDRSFSTLAKAADSLVFKGIGGITKKCGWEYDTLSQWKNITGKRWLIIAEGDSIVKKEASLLAALNKTGTFYDGLWELEKEYSSNMAEIYSRSRFKCSVGKVAHNVAVHGDIMREVFEAMHEATVVDRD